MHIDAHQYNKPSMKTFPHPNTCPVNQAAIPSGELLTASNAIETRTSQIQILNTKAEQLYHRPLCHHPLHSHRSARKGNARCRTFSNLSRSPKWMFRGRRDLHRQAIYPKHSTTSKSQTCFQTRSPILRLHSHDPIHQKTQQGGFHSQ